MVSALDDTLWIKKVGNIENCMRRFVSRIWREAECPDGEIWNRPRNGLCVDFTL